MLLVSNPMALPNEKRMIPLIDCRGPSASNNRFHPDHTSVSVTGSLQVSEPERTTHL
jgi:hypothetical protein